jgi:hypothetical protein
LFHPSYSLKTSTGNELVKAQNIINSKELGDDGVIVQMVVWQVQQPLKGSNHDFKYRLYCGRRGKCLVRYDNEDGKGDHRHYGDREEAYPYVSLEQLILDFLNDVKRLKR